MLELGGAELNMIDEEHDHDDQINGTVASRQVRMTIFPIYTGIRRLGHFTAPIHSSKDPFGVYRGRMDNVTRQCDNVAYTRACNLRPVIM